MAVVEPEDVLDEETTLLIKEPRSGVFWNLLAILGLAAMVLAIGYFFVVFRNPSSSLNPFPPPTLPVRVIIPSVTPRPTDNTVTQVAVPTGSVTEQPGVTGTPLSGTVTANLATPVADSTIQAPTPTVRSNSIYPFERQSAPSAINASVLYPDRDCKWMGVGGQVLDLQGRPYTGITIQLGGSLEGKALFLTSLTGTALQYGPAGYEFTLADMPIATRNQLWLRLVDQAGLALSDKVFFDTGTDCNQNLIVINFKQVK